MTVKEYIETTKKPYIKIGAKNGSSFIFCGDPKKFMEFEQEYNPKERQRLISIVIKLENELENFYPNYKKIIFRQYKEYKKYKINGGNNKNFKKYKTVAEYVEHLKRLREKDYERLESSLKRNTKYRDIFTDISTREVKEVYPSILTNKYGFIDEIVLFKGYETGKYWDLDEYENGGELGVVEYE